MKSLWNLGFRPFYLLAAVFAALSVPLWALQYSGLAAGVLRGPAWHGHEMLFGYTLAVVAGFLFTAVRNWTQRDTPAGAALAAIAALWVAGRILVLTPLAMAAAIVNALFPVAVAIGIGVPLVASGNRRNYFFIALLLGLAAAELLFHFDLARVSLRAGLDVVLFIVAVIGGRVIPMFTNNGVPGAGASRRPWLEKAALGSLLVLLAVDVFGLDGIALALAAGIAAVLHLMRFWLWHPWATRSNPLVWSLHAAYAWVVIHLALRMLAAVDLAPATLATHALTIGLIGGMTLAMMTRTAKGHTGRILAADRWEVACYTLVQVAALVRVLGPMLPGAAYVATVAVSAACWSMAFAIYAVRYWPILSRPRVDGCPG